MSESRSNQLKRVTEIYDELAPTWDQRAGFVERRLMGSAIREELGSRLHGHVLEIGTGSGATLPYVTFGDTGVTSFVGTDLSLGMMREIKTRSPRLHLARMSADALAFPDATFDVVTCSLTLCTVPDPEVALREMSRVCKPDGEIVLLEHVLARNPVLSWLQRRLAPAQVRHMGCHLDRETDRLLHDMGFRIEFEQRRFFGIFVLSVVRPIGNGDRAA
jgi:ubiquinone/menaquinone biosynthesis C-methylase UbiE